MPYKHTNHRQSDMHVKFRGSHQYVAPPACGVSSNVTGGTDDRSAGIGCHVVSSEAAGSDETAGAGVTTTCRVMRRGRSCRRVRAPRVQMWVGTPRSIPTVVTGGYVWSPALSDV